MASEGLGPPDPDAFVVVIRTESDIGPARIFAREACKLVGLRGYAAQRVVTAVSELARNIARYVGEGRVCLRIDPDECRLWIVAEDEGPGIANLEDILAGRYRSRTGLGRGLIGVKRLADVFEIETGEGGTRVVAAFVYSGGSR